MTQRAVRRDDRDSAHGDVLADLGDELGTSLLYAAAVGERLVRKRVDVGRTRRQRRIGNGLGEGNEVLVLRDKIRFRVHFDDHGLAAVRPDYDSSVRGDPAGLLVGLGLPGLAQQLRCGFHIAVGLDERLLALHHAGAGALAQLFHH